MLASQTTKEAPAMKVNSLLINVTSDHPKELAGFYREVVGLAPKPEIGDEAFDAGGTAFIIDGHSETKGPTKEPQRVLINFFVDDLAAEQQRLEKKGVTFIRSAGQEEWGGIISTFQDPDGNYCQLIEFRP
jgi:predicted enzyme related to lactoylglutathione lyase